MDLRHIEYVVELARTGSLTQTAVNLRVAQPSISQAITALERQFGVALFDRTTRPVQPTPAGRSFIEQSQRVLAEMSRLHRVATEHSSLLRGRLSIGTTFWVGESVLPNLLVEFHKLYPGITFALRRESMPKLIDGVRTGLYDIAFVDAPEATKTDDLVWHTFHIDELALAVPLGHPLADRKSVELADLVGEPFIAHETDSIIHASFQQAAHATGFIPTVVATTQSQAILRSLVSSGLGIAVGSRMFFENVGLPVRTIPLLPQITKKTSLVVRRDGVNNVTHPFFDFIHDRLIRS